MKQDTRLGEIQIAQFRIRPRRDRDLLGTVAMNTTGSVEHVHCYCTRNTAGDLMCCRCGRALNLKVRFYSCSGFNGVKPS